MAVRCPIKKPLFCGECVVIPKRWGGQGRRCPGESEGRPPAIIRFSQSRTGKYRTGTSFSQGLLSLFLHESFFKTSAVIAESTSRRHAVDFYWSIIYELGSCFRGAPTSRPRELPRPLTDINLRWGKKNTMPAAWAQRPSNPLI